MDQVLKNPRVTVYLRWRRADRYRLSPQELHRGDEVFATLQRAAGGGDGWYWRGIGAAIGDAGTCRLLGEAQRAGRKHVVAKLRELGQ